MDHSCKNFLHHFRGIILKMQRTLQIKQQFTGQPVD